MRFTDTVRTRVLYSSVAEDNPRRYLQKFFARARVGDQILCSPYSAEELRQCAAQYGLLLEFEPLSPREGRQRPAHICRIVARRSRPPKESAA